ncbi:MAG: hypothetical protein ABIH99_01925 [Candidatus Micrarchaeota archaeon]
MKTARLTLEQLAASPEYSRVKIKELPYSLKWNIFKRVLPLLDRFSLEEIYAEIHRSLYITRKKNFYRLLEPFGLDKEKISTIEFTSAVTGEKWKLTDVYMPPSLASVEAIIEQKRGVATPEEFACECVNFNLQRGMLCINEAKKEITFIRTLGFKDHFNITNALRKSQCLCLEHEEKEKLIFGCKIWVTIRGENIEVLLGNVFHSKDITELLKNTKQISFLWELFNTLANGKGEFKGLKNTWRVGKIPTPEFIVKMRAQDITTLPENYFEQYKVGCEKKNETPKSN